MPDWLHLPLAVLAIGALCAAMPASADAKPLRPPAVPLVTHDPYFSIWSPADSLTDAPTIHWTGAPHRLTALIRIDGAVMRLMGTEPKDVPAMRQTALEVHPTRTAYRFAGEGLELTLTFMTPALPHDLDVLARPITYITFAARSADGKPHSVEVLFDASAEIAANTPDQHVQSERVTIGRLTALKAGTTEQPVLGKKGDNLRIDWGYLYVAAATDRIAAMAVTDANGRIAFAKTGALSLASRPSPLASDQSLAVALDMGRVGSRVVRRTVMIGYDDLWSIEYFRTKLRPYWRRNGDDMEAVLRKAADEQARLTTACARFDAEIERDLRAAGGEEYVRLGVLAYRQALAGNKLAADANGRPLLFPKENFSNGCIATVDVIYPMAPQFLLFSPTLVKAMLIPILDYAASPRWRWPFAPHDLGTYPRANGQVYGGGERTEENQMPVEESGNMLILMAALARIEGNADFAARYWPQLSRWAEYLKDKGFDPENQLCTDDFAGHLAHNVNLSAKAIMGLASYALLCDMRGEKERAEAYRALSRDFAARWVQAAADEGRYRLAFDRPGTWSQKYNLVWDRILGFGLFPDHVLKTEMAWYRRTQNRFGLPLDNRRDYTKLDWTVWTACLSGNRADFDALIAPVADWLNATPDRVPITDWYDTKTGKCVGFRARPVVGGLFIKLLYDASVWRRWARRDGTPDGPWAPLPAPPQVTAVVAAADREPAEWRYTFDEPGTGWEKPEFDDRSWSLGRSGFGTPQTPGAIIGTRWTGSRIWIRRTFQLRQSDLEGLRLWVHHDEDAVIYLNGVLAASLNGFVTEYGDVEISPTALAALRPGVNTLAVHCRQTAGGQYVDVGLVQVRNAR
ncbi:MAG: DUF4965 domain-containing protein [Chthonomonadales bacterium]|nr:DUF4965 domain-containing protein [Chthonomonadales bacterium]